MDANLIRRVGAASVFAPALAATVWWGGIPLLVCTASFVGVGTWELFRLYQQKGACPFLWPGILMGVSICVWFHELGLRHIEGLFMLCTVGTLTTALIQRRGGASLRDAGATLFGVLYVGLLGGAILLVRNLPLPCAAPLALTVLVSIWIMDTVAYFAGRAFGRTRPFTRISPKKSVEGCIAGVFGAVGTVWLGALWMKVLLLPDILALGLIVGIGGQVGDFAESLLKRDSGVKDSSDIIPGHGGILDRFDSALFAFPLVYIYLVFRYGI
ncbi:MAG: phosphatidate cytidylyltransferase [Candidatus Latescibacteria bacterium]|nr:phosphatidate cytidylyltransferase [Candidatus Latescibacterota bacterium]